MPKREDINTVLVIGSGPIIIGQACEFDYSGTQACKALRGLGYKIVLVNSNPATIMTDPETADVTYIEPLNVERLTQIIEKERPDALLPNLGGQSALNLCSELSNAGVLDKYNVQVLGVKVDAIERGEDRLEFKKAMNELGVEMARSEIANTVDEALAIADKLGYPVVVRPAYTMGGAGGGLVYNVDELKTVVNRGLQASLVHQCLIEESILGWEELELEVFVHGAMCMSYSGRCLLSSYMTGRDSNRGACAQSCRWKYSLVEEKRPNQYFPIEEDQHGTYIMNSKDLCMIHYIPELVKSGIYSFKIEGLSLIHI